MEVAELKQKLHTIIDNTSNEVLLEDLLAEAITRTESKLPHELEGLSKEDYDELVSLVNEPPKKDTISYEELKSNLSRWFTP
jgi:hypothetical protein